MNWTERLQNLDACAVSDALDKLALKGAAPGIVRQATAKRIAGRVRVVRLEAGSGNAGGPHLGVRAIDAGAPGEIIVLEQRTGIEAACWGGILSTAAQHNGIAGVIAEGLVRDVDEAGALGFPMFARGVTTRTARGRIAESSFSARVLVGNVEVRDGDYAIADGSGVVFIRAGEIDRVTAAAEAIRAREASIVRAILDGRPLSEALGAAYERMLGE